MQFRHIPAIAIRPRAVVRNLRETAGDSAVNSEPDTSLAAFPCIGDVTAAQNSVQDARFGAT